MCSGDFTPRKGEKEERGKRREGGGRREEEGRKRGKKRGRRRPSMRGDAYNTQPTTTTDESSVSELFILVRKIA